MPSEMILKGMRENNLKGVDLKIPKQKIVVFTGVSGSGKSSIVFDTIAAEASRQINETYPAWVRTRLPKFEKPKADSLENLTAAVIVDQKQFGGNARSTVGTMTDLSSQLRLLFSRLGQPCAGTSSNYSFNNPTGMCLTCSGLGRETTLNIDKILDSRKSLNEGALADPVLAVGGYLWGLYTGSGWFDNDKPICEYDEATYNLLLYGSEDGVSEPRDKRLDGIFTRLKRLYLNRDISTLSKHSQKRIVAALIERECPSCHGARLNEAALASKIKGYNIVEMSHMEIGDLVKLLKTIKEPHVQTVLESLIVGLERIVNIGLSYLHLNRESATLSGGEAQRLKMVRYMGSSLTDMTYIFDEPSTGLHPRDVERMNNLLQDLRDKGNTVLVVEHDPDVIRIADEIIDIGPYAGANGGRVTFQGSLEELLKTDTLTAQGLRKQIRVNDHPSKPTGYFPIRNACLHNLKHVDVDIPLGILTAITGVAGSGKSSLISGVFAKECPEAIMVNQSPITANSRSIPASYLGFMDEIRKLFAKENKVEAGLFSFNSIGACPDCSGKGVIVTELAFMDPIVTICESCEGKRYSKEALSYTIKGKNIIEVLELTVEQALKFFEDKKVKKHLMALEKVGLDYMTLGQPLSTLSGGELQRIKLAKEIHKKGNVFILDEPTTGLHISDINKLMKLFHQLVEQGNTVIVIEHNLDVIKQADYVIDIGPEGGKNGGQVVFTGTPQALLESQESITAACMRQQLKNN